VSLFETESSLTISATAYDVRAPAGALDFLADTEAATSLPFLTYHASFLAEAVARGEPRNVRLIRPRCRFFPTCVGFHDRDTEPSAPPPWL
jgi:hypothetical protein